MTSRHRTPAELPLDHLIVAATNLEQGVAWIEERLGAHPQPGGKHVAMGTHNALLRIGARVYLEIIAIDPEAAAPKRSRWMDLDEPRMRAALAEGPALIHWAVATRDIESDVTRSPIDLARSCRCSAAICSGDSRSPKTGIAPGAAYCRR